MEHTVLSSMSEMDKVSSTASAGTVSGPSVPATAARPTTPGDLPLAPFPPPPFWGAVPLNYFKQFYKYLVMSP